MSEATRDLLSKLQKDKDFDSSHVVSRFGSECVYTGIKYALSKNIQSLKTNKVYLKNLTDLVSYMVVYEITGGDDFTLTSGHGDNPNGKKKFNGLKLKKTMVEKLIELNG